MNMFKYHYLNIFTPNFVFLKKVCFVSETENSDWICFDSLFRFQDIVKTTVVKKRLRKDLSVLEVYIGLLTLATVGWATGHQ